MTAQEGQGSDEQKHQSPPNTESDADQPGRKVAKTIVEGTLPQIPETAQSSPSERTDSQEPKRVAKTMLEINRPNADEIIAASSDAAQAQQAERKVAKTMMDVSRPELPKQTMLEISRPQLPKKTMLEMSLPAQSDTLKQVKKVSKTRLDVNSLDAIGMAKALKQEQQQQPVPVKVRKTLTSERAILNLSESLQTDTVDDTKTVVSAESNLNQAGQEEQPDKPSLSTKNPRKRTRGTERFVAKTILDHSVLSEQLVKSHEKEKMKAAYIAQERTLAPAREFHGVDSKKMASPCAWTWNANSGKDRVKACERCQTKVYDLSGMEMPEAEALIFKHESKKKFTLYKRLDGKFMISDCPVQAQRKRNLILLCLAGALIMICALSLMLMMPPPQKQSPDTVRNSSQQANQPANTNSDPSSGKVHFEAGKAELQEAPNPGLFPTVKATPDDAEQQSAAGSKNESSNAPASNSSSQTGSENGPSSQASKSNAPGPNPTGSNGDSSNKYWDDGK